MNRCVWVSAIALALTGMSAGAEEAAEKGFYIGAAVGQANHDFAESDGINLAISGIGSGFVIHVDPASVDTEDDASAWSATLGYRINRYVAAEVSYMDLGDVDVVVNYDTAGLVPFFPDITREFNVALAGPVASVLGSLPVGAGFELHARIGYLFAHQDVEEQFASRQSLGNDAWIGGAGATWSFAKRWAVRLEYLRTDDLDGHERIGESKVDVLNLGALFRL
jgi:opacity protein-like surface antigen